MAEKVKPTGLNIAALVLGIVSIVFWCVWFIAIPCAILALIFGIIGIKKAGKGFALAGIITSSIALAILTVIFGCIFLFGIFEEIDSKSTRSSRSNNRIGYSYYTKLY